MSNNITVKMPLSEFKKFEKLEDDFNEKEVHYKEALIVAWLEMKKHAKITGMDITNKVNYSVDKTGHVVIWKKTEQ